MVRKPVLFSVLALCVAMLSCNLPSGQQANAVEATLTAIAVSSQASQAGGGQATTVAPTDAALVSTNTSAPAATAEASATACSAMLTANSNVNVRRGPGTVYDAVGALLTGQTAPLAGKSADGSWWYINFPAGPGGYGWVSASVVTAACVPGSLVVVAAPPTPVPASGTCQDNFVWRLIRNSDKVCVPPASKAQAQADNAAAASRVCTATYGADTCAQGFVWRDAFSGDHVCVVPATRSLAAADNAAASSRWTSGAYGAHTCINGYVWREANGPSDDVCVLPATRSQAASDNAAAASHLCTAAYGPDTCAQGYVWRAAFPSDHVCVTPAIRDAVAADNAAAPSHTWP